VFVVDTVTLSSPKLWGQSIRQLWWASRLNRSPFGHKRKRALIEILSNTFEYFQSAVVE
jgi:hypothetical protein